MLHLTYEMILDGAMLRYRVIEQKKRGARRDLFFKSSVGVTVKSVSRPEITRMSIYLRGRSEQYDTDWVSNHYGSVEKAQLCASKFQAALQEWADCGGWDGMDSKYDETRHVKAGFEVPLRRYVKAGFEVPLSPPVFGVIQLEDSLEYQI